MCSIMILIIWVFAVPGNMPLTAKICLEILCNCQLLCLLIFILMLPKHVYGIAQMGEEKTVIECTGEALPGATNWTSLHTCCPFTTRDPALLSNWSKYQLGVGWGNLTLILLFALLCKLLWINSPISQSSARDNVESNQERRSWRTSPKNRGCFWSLFYS